MSWIELESSTYQHHVIHHVLGATVLGWVVIGDALHVLLDIGLLWTIYVNGEMSLMAQAVAIQDLVSDETSEIQQLTSDAQLLISEGREAAGLARFTPAPVECAIISVDVFASGSLRKIVVAGETADLTIETSMDRSHFAIDHTSHP
ncbi:MAG TPA: hypothetical protein VE961_11505 [Pyrinomonadaceae bacterium]|nr:hypothetical protein [Pyrinomonadaceae bacterium]